MKPAAMLTVRCCIAYLSTHSPSCNQFSTPTFCHTVPHSPIAWSTIIHLSFIQPATNVDQHVVNIGKVLIVNSR